MKFSNIKHYLTLMDTSIPVYSKQRKRAFARWNDREAYYKYLTKIKQVIPRSIETFIDRAKMTGSYTSTNTWESAVEDRERLPAGSVQLIFTGADHRGFRDGLTYHLWYGLPPDLPVRRSFISELSDRDGAGDYPHWVRDEFSYSPPEKKSGTAIWHHSILLSSGEALCIPFVTFAWKSLILLENY